MKKNIKENELLKLRKLSDGVFIEEDEREEPKVDMLAYWCGQLNDMDTSDEDLEELEHQMSEAVEELLIKLDKVAKRKFNAIKPCGDDCYRFKDYLNDWYFGNSTSDGGFKSILSWEPGKFKDYVRSQLKEKIKQEIAKERKK